MVSGICLVYHDNYVFKNSSLQYILLSLYKYDIHNATNLEIGFFNCLENTNGHVAMEYIDTVLNYLLKLSQGTRGTKLSIVSTQLEFV